MAYDEKLAERVRRELASQKALAEIKMFGGLCFTLRGNMCCGVLKDQFIAKVAPEDADKFLGEPHVRMFDFSGRPMKSILYVGPKALASAPALRKWVKRSVEFCLTRPPKA